MDAPCDRINAAALLLAGRDPERIALACGEQRIGYGELRAAVAVAAAAWLDCDVQPGELVLVRGLHDIEQAVAFLGAIWAGAVPMPLASPAEGLGLHRHTPVRFVLDDTREGYADRWRDQVMTLAEWRMYLRVARPAPAALVPAEAAACWTQVRRGGGGARLLAHRFALNAASSRRGSDRERVRVGGALGMLQVLRRGGTAVLDAPTARSAGLPGRARERLAVP
jgi:hypothetical protein